MCQHVVLIDGQRERCPPATAGDGAEGSRVGVFGSPWSRAGGMRSTAEMGAVAKSAAGARPPGYAKYWAGAKSVGVGEARPFGVEKNRATTKSEFAESSGVEVDQLMQRAKEQFELYLDNKGHESALRLVERFRERFS